MLWQVSGSMFFDSLETRDFYLNKILAWEEKGFLEQSCGGDFIFPRYVKDWGDVEPPSGPYRLAWRLRVTDEADKNSIVSYYYNHVEGDINKDYPGYFEGHKCYHDSGRPCREKTIDEW